MASSTLGSSMAATTMPLLPPASTLSSTYPPPPPGLNYIQIIQPLLTLLMIGSVLATLLVPVHIALLFFSTAESRRRPVFWLNIGAIWIGLGIWILTCYETIHGILSPLNPGWIFEPTLFALFITLTPLVVESILILRLLALFPWRTTPRTLFAAIFAFPVLVKIARLAVYIMFFKEWVPLTDGGMDALTAVGEIWGTQPYTKAQWFLELMDNSYISILFLWQLKRLDAQRPQGVKRPYTIAARLKALFYIALTTYMFPACLSVVELILAFQPSLCLQGTYVLYFDVYVSILGVVFSTVWATGTSAPAMNTEPSHLSFNSSSRYQRPFRGMESSGVVGALASDIESYDKSGNEPMEMRRAAGSPVEIFVRHSRIIEHHALLFSHIGRRDSYNQNCVLNERMPLCDFPTTTRRHLVDQMCSKE